MEHQMILAHSSWVRIGVQSVSIIIPLLFSGAFQLIFSLENKHSKLKMGYFLPKFRPKNLRPSAWNKTQRSKLKKVEGFDRRLRPWHTLPGAQKQELQKPCDLEKIDLRLSFMSFLIQNWWVEEARKKEGQYFFQKSGRPNAYWAFAFIDSAI